MAPFYLLLALLTLALLDLLRLLWRALALRRGFAFVRQPPPDDEAPDWLLGLRQAAGPDYRVWPMVAPAAVLAPARGVNRALRSRARAVLREGVLDFVIASADGMPLVVAQLFGGEQTRQERRASARLVRACATAGLPVVELPVTAPPDPATLTRLIQEALALAPVPPRRDRAAPAPEPEPEPADPEELDALARLSAAMRDLDLVDPPRSERPTVRK